MLPWLFLLYCRKQFVLRSLKSSRVCIFVHGCSLSLHWVELWPVVGIEKPLIPLWAVWSRCRVANWKRTVLPLIISWQWNETLSQESNQTLKLPLSGGHCLQISRAVLALSLYVIVSLSSHFSDTPCAVISGRAAMLCRFLAWLPKWNLGGMCLS